MRVCLLAAAVVAGMIAATAPARADTEFPYCSSDGFGMARDCSYSTLAQCQAAVQGVGTTCEKNSRYTAPAVVPEPAPAPAQAATPRR